ncbi:MAG TPA: HAD family hydrolase [Gammaproteobacteria bacterium]|nr:HAD family hydrolase [Gammaproteobacteria bacterium]
MGKLQALLFDVDGTLADTERDGHRVAFNQAFEEAGMDWNWSVDLYGELLAVTGGKERIRFYIDKWHPLVPETDDLDAFIAGLHARKTFFYTELLKQGNIPMRPGVRRLLDQAREAGLRLAIVTTTTPANVTALLTHALDPDALSWFELIAAGDIVAAKKPAPDIYSYTLDQMDLKPEQCLALEDSHNGVISSTMVDILTLVTVNDYTRDHSFPGVDLVLDQLGEPDSPVKVLHGDLGGKTYVDLDVLQRLHAQSGLAQKAS